MSQEKEKEKRKYTAPYFKEYKIRIEQSVLAGSVGTGETAPLSDMDWEYW